MGEQKYMDAETFQESVALFRTMFLMPDELRLTDEELKNYDAQALIKLVLDAATADSLASFQALNDLPVTGELDKVTWKHLALHFPLAANLTPSQEYPFEFRSQ